MKSNWKQTKVPDETYVLLGVENIDQNAFGAINGCEAASLLEGLHFVDKAKEFDYPSFLKTMPIDPDGNPNQAFGGSAFFDTPGKLEAIFIKPLIEWGSHFGHLSNLSGLKLAALSDIIRTGKPILVYVSIGFRPFSKEKFSFGEELTNNHAVILDGFSEHFVHLSDPIDGRYWLKKNKFEEIYKVRKWAVAIS
ncbi:hypothetical protein DLJ48_08225 [Oenococcus sicerae]|uniref:Peptidase C39-like domain-containing protein n=1 Tax=Oenococcus sicerae TaxID=2203724 RepID=A0ABX5QP34_9LACO|nr:C39 family peptidase [Oenococcus sicerae]QAS70507.1 hypothetical protein DLJ48_08225 [Oenococcus sicerae]